MKIKIRNNCRRRNESPSWDSCVRSLSQASLPGIVFLGDLGRKQRAGTASLCGQSLGWLPARTEAAPVTMSPFTYQPRSVLALTYRGRETFVPSPVTAASGPAGPPQLALGPGEVDVLCHPTLFTFL